MKVFINKLNLLASPYVKDATIEIDISNEEAERIKVCPVGKAWQWNTKTNSFDLITTVSRNEIRDIRADECFTVVDRNTLWYKTLTEQQTAELAAWRLAWLDAPENGIIPEKPEWLK